MSDLGATPAINIPIGNQNSMNLIASSSPFEVPKTPPATPEISSMKPPEVTSDKNKTTSSGLREIPKPPSYISASFVETALSKKHPGIKVNHLNVAPAVSVGENYMCIVYRADVGTNQGPFALIIKCLSETRSDFVADSGFTKREMDVYNETFPILFEGISIDDQPKTVLCYYTVYEGLKDAMVFQDMKPYGYRTTDRQAGLDIHHCRCALKELAKFHALAIKLRMEKPELFKSEILDKYPEAVYVEKNREMLEMFLKSNFANISQGVRDNFPLRFHALTDLIEFELSDYLFDIMLNQLSVTPEGSNNRVLVLNHGDFWSSNILFQYEEESRVPSSCCMIDFQIARVGSPVFDLLYFFLSSTVKSTRDQYLQELLQLYLDQVYETLANLKISKPLPPHMFYENVDELKSEIQAFEMFGFIIGSMIMSVVVANPEDAPDMDTLDQDILNQDTSAFAKLYANPIFKSRFREILEDFDNSGFFVRCKQFINEKKQEKEKKIAPPEP